MCNIGSHWQKFHCISCRVGKKVKQIGLAKIVIVITKTSFPLTLSVMGYISGHHMQKELSLASKLWILGPFKNRAQKLEKSRLQNL